MDVNGKEAKISISIKCRFLRWVSRERRQCCSVDVSHFDAPGARNRGSLRENRTACSSASKRLRRECLLMSQMKCHLAEDVKSNYGIAPQSHGGERL